MMNDNISKYLDEIIDALYKYKKEHIMFTRCNEDFNYICSKADYIINEYKDRCKNNLYYKIGVSGIYFSEDEKAIFNNVDIL